jgi:hypothetical protein
VAGSSQTSGGPELKASAFSPASTIARSSGRTAHRRRPNKEARLEGLGRLAVMVSIVPVIGVHKDVGAALQFGVDAARRFELKGAGAVPGGCRALGAVGYGLSPV